jgi:hypothetical protein
MNRKSKGSKKPMGLKIKMHNKRNGPKGPLTLD